ncbi:tyrosine-type recombinase/integrase [Variovorax sp. ZT5P49]|uniref:tyrosine-type recombinase/integrase n=1 Tax=Variovorax sp. ZT5P49 TaxID=3443733 RepID=UPI003F467C2B
MSIWIDKQGRRHVGLMVSGRRVHRILPEGASASDAKQLEADLRRRLTAPKPLAGDPLLVAVMPLYLAHAKGTRWPEQAKQCAMRIQPWLTGFRASQAREVAATIIRDMKPKYAPATINRSLATLKKALSLAWELGQTEINHGAAIKSLPPNNKREVFLTPAQVEKLAGHCPEPVQAAIWIALYTGARRGEILAMKPEDVAKTALTIHARNTKTLRTRVIPIVKPLRPWLKHLPLPYKDYEGLKSGFQRGRKAAGMEHVNFHDLRHSCASILVASGADLYTVSKILGHSSIITTQRYSHLQVKQQRSAMVKAFA